MLLPHRLPACQVVLAGALFLKPQIVTQPVVTIWKIGEVLINRFFITRDMAARGADLSSLA